CVVDRMAHLMPENAHAPFWRASLDFEHLGEFQSRQARMREIKRNRDPGDAIGREPLVREPVMGAEAHPARLELTCNGGDPSLELGPSDRETEVANAKVEESF